MATTTTAPPNSKALPAKTERHWIAEWVLTVLMLLFGTTTVLQAFIVPTGSMEGTVLIGDHLIVDKLAYSPHGNLSRILLPYQDVRRGDIAVFRFPPDPKQPYVKRVIGVPGDRIRFSRKRLYLNGVRVEEPYVQQSRGEVSKYLSNFPTIPDLLIEPRGVEMLNRHVRGGELIVPDGSYFMLGDNRDNSSDSRFWGLVPRENIIGKPVMVFWSYDAPTEELEGGILNPSHVLDLAQNFFVKTRWTRTFRLVRAHPLESPSQPD
jgi:signal peptidase I